MIRFIAVILGLSLSGCALLFSADSGPKEYYLLEGKECQSNTDYKPTLGTLLLFATKASPTIYSNKILFSKSALTRGYYQLSFWSEPPPDRFNLILQRNLECLGAFRAVIRNSSDSDRILVTEIVEFYHDATSQPGQVVTDIRAELLDAKTRSLIAHQNFKHSIITRSFDAKGAVDAFNQAVNQTIDEISTWVANQ